VRNKDRKDRVRNKDRKDRVRNKDRKDRVRNKDRNGDRLGVWAGTGKRRQKNRKRDRDGVQDRGRGWCQDSIGWG
jgi:hypothetical protein